MGKYEKPQRNDVYSMKTSE
jgi:hypothetical protein